MSMKHKARVYQWAMVVGLLCGLTGSALAQGRGNPNPGIAPIQSKPYGQSYGDWAAAWWTWAEETDFAPIDDETGEDCHLGQAGPVWFLAGNNGGFTERTCVVPPGKGLFFPILNGVGTIDRDDPDDLDFWEFLMDFLGFDFDELTDEEILRIGINWFMDFAHDLNVTINGVPVRQPETYRADSPLFEHLDLPAVADGYWIMLNPLPPGEHVIHFSGMLTIEDFGLSFFLDVTYHLTVLPKGRGG